MEENNIVVLVDEEGKKVEFDHLMTFEHLDISYIALMPMDDVEGMDDDEVLIMQVVSDGDEDAYKPVENPVLLEEVFETFLDLYEEMIDEED